MQKLENLNQASVAMPTHHHWLADGILLATAIMWGANILVFKHAISDLDPWVFNAFRLIFAVFTLGTLAGIERKYFPRRSSDTASIPWVRVAMFCLLNGFLYLIIFVKGISLTTAGNTALILASLPMWTSMLSYLLLAERLPRVTWVGLLVTFVGTVIVITQSGGEVSLSSEFFVGNLLMLLAALSWAAGTVLSRSILHSMTPLQLAFLSSITTTPLHLLIAAPMVTDNWEALIQPANLVAMVYSGVFSTGIAYATWHAGVRLVGASHASVYQNVVTLVAVVGGWIFLREQFLVIQVLGGALTILGLFLMRRARTR